MQTASTVANVANTFLSIDDLEAALLAPPEKAQKAQKALTLQEIEALCAPMFEQNGVDDLSRKKLNDYACFPSNYYFDAEKAFKELGVIAVSARSSKTKRILEKANVNLLLEDEGGIHSDAKIMITKQDLYKALQRVSRDKRFVNYFSLKLVLADIYSRYMTAHSNATDAKDAEDDEDDEDVSLGFTHIDHPVANVANGSEATKVEEATDAVLIESEEETSFVYRSILGQRLVGNRHEVLLEGR